MHKRNVPKENIEGYSFLFDIENALRELIINSLLKLDGPRWYKKRIPGDVLGKYQNAIKAERKIKWTKLIPHHPIYYIEFPDLKKILSRDDNWNDAFKNIFGPNKEVIITLLSEIEPVRNDLAHNRKLDTTSLVILKAAYAKLATFLGAEAFSGLSIRCTLLKNIKQELTLLQEEARLVYDNCRGLRAINALHKWDSIQTQWWFDEIYLGHALDDIASFFRSMEEYSLIPRQRGVGHKIESWIKNNCIEEKYSKTSNALSVILNEWREQNGFKQSP